MLFGVVSGVGQGVGELDGMEIVGREGVVLWVNVGHPIVTNGDFVAQLFSAARGGNVALPKLHLDFLFLLKDKTRFQKKEPNCTYYKKFIPFIWEAIPRLS